MEELGASSPGVLMTVDRDELSRYMEELGASSPGVLMTYLLTGTS